MINIEHFAFYLKVTSNYSEIRTQDLRKMVYLKQCVMLHNLDEYNDHNTLYMLYQTIAKQL